MSWNWEDKVIGNVVPDRSTTGHTYKVIGWGTVGYTVLSNNSPEEDTQRKLEEQAGQEAQLLGSRLPQQGR